MNCYVLVYISHNPENPVELVNSNIYVDLDKARTDLEDYILAKEGRTRNPTDPQFVLESTWTCYLKAHIDNYGDYNYYTPKQDFQFKEFDVCGQTVIDIVGPVKRYAIHRLVINEQ